MIIFVYLQTDGLDVVRHGIVNLYDDMQRIMLMFNKTRKYIGRWKKMLFL